MPKDLAIAMLEIDEGLRLKPYRCTSGKLTIGYGRNLDDRGITEAEADAMLLRDVTDYHHQLSKFPAFAKLNEARQSVLINMTFNLGMGGIRNFKMMWAAISLENYQGAAVQMLQSKWASQVGARAARLAEIMRTGSI